MMEERTGECKIKVHRSVLRVLCNAARRAERQEGEAGRMKFTVEQTGEMYGPV